MQLLKIDGYCATAAMETSEFIKSRWNIYGHEWEVRFYPDYWHFFEDLEETYYQLDDHSEWVALKLILVSEPGVVMANLSCRLVDPSRNRDPSEEKSVCYAFGRNGGGRTSPEVLLVRRDEVPSSGYLVNDSLTDAPSPCSRNWLL